jgi:hypothetical protein
MGVREGGRTMAEFEPMPLPGEGGDVAADIAAWIDSPAMAALLGEFGLEPPPPGPLADRLGTLEEASDLWDYRNGKERWEARAETFTPERDALVHAAARALGLLGRSTPNATEYDHLLVLGAGVGPMMGRSGLAAEVLRNGTRAGTVWAMGSRRELVKQVPGLPECPTEDDAVMLSLRRAFGLGEPTASHEGTDPAGWQWWTRIYADARPPVYVLTAPAVGPNGKRPTTPDGFVSWSKTVPDPRGSRLLLVTTDLFVPFQHCAAVHALGLPLACTVDTIGFDRSASPYEPPHRTTELLQETRSAIQWMRQIALAL